MINTKPLPNELLPTCMVVSIVRSSYCFSYWYWKRMWPSAKCRTWNCSAAVKKQWEKPREKDHHETATTNHRIEQEKIIARFELSITYQNVSDSDSGIWVVIYIKRKFFNFKYRRMTRYLLLILSQWYTIESLSLF